MFDHLMSAAQWAARQEARNFVTDTPRQLILDMDAEKVRFPRVAAGRRQTQSPPRLTGSTTPLSRKEGL